MTDVKPAIWGTALVSWRDGLRAIRDMPVVTIVAVMASFLIATADGFLWTGPSGDKPIGIQFFSSGLSVLLIFLLAPVAIAIHRYVLLNEITGRYTFGLSDGRVATFFGYGVLVNLMFEIQEFIGHPGIRIGLLGAGIMIAVQTLVLFPAIAIDGPRANFFGAMQVTKGHFWRIFLIAAIIALPFLLLVLLVVALFFYLDWQDMAVPKNIITASIAIAMFAAYVSMASHLYRAWVFKKTPAASR